MQKIKLTFNVLPFIDDFPGQSEVEIERHAWTHDQTEEIVKAANVLGAKSIAIENDAPITA